MRRALTLLVLMLVAGAACALPAGVRRTADIAYGTDPRQRFDVYRPDAPDAAPAPILLMVHGGAWMIGNKAMPQVVDNKVARWVTRGAILVSVDYRLVPRASPLEQAGDVAQALAAVQRLAPSWGGDPRRIVLIGHSAGAHLVALVSASTVLAQRAGAQPWLGTVVLDGAALDVDELMRAPHPRFYDRVFGADPAAWRAASPYAQLGAGVPPLLIVCSTQRVDGSCRQAQHFAAQAQARGARASVLPQDLSHREINETLGLDGPETDAVQGFLDAVGWSAR